VQNVEGMDQIFEILESLDNGVVIIRPMEFHLNHERIGPTRLMVHALAMALWQASTDKQSKIRHTFGPLLQLIPVGCKLSFAIDISFSSKKSRANLDSSRYGCTKTAEPGWRCGFCQTSFCQRACQRQRPNPYSAKLHAFLAVKLSRRSGP
jgi:hypothetical protein